MSKHRPLRIFSGDANRPLAEEVVQILDTTLGDITITHLPDSEIHVQINEPVRGEDVFVIQPCAIPVNDNLMELLLLIDAFRRASAASITAVVPYFPYGRQERMGRGREAISAKVVASAIEMFGASRVMYFDVHAAAIQGFFNIPVDPLSAFPVFADHFKHQGLENAVACPYIMALGQASTPLTLKEHRKDQKIIVSIVVGGHDRLCLDVIHRYQHIVCDVFTKPGTDCPRKFVFSQG